MRPIQLNLVELMVAIPFAGLFTATVFACLAAGGGSFYVPLLFLQVVLFPLIYMVLLLMMRQHREKWKRSEHESDADAP